MPIEIKEISIKTTIETLDAMKREPINYNKLKNEIMRDCIKQINKTLKTQKER